MFFFMVDPTLRENLKKKLRSQLNRYPKRIQAAATYIVENEVDFGLDPIRVSAEKANVSAGTFVRLAEILGFEQFSDLRSPFRNAIASTYLAGLSEEHPQTQEGSDASRATAEVIRNELSVVGRSLQLLGPDKALRIAEALRSAERVFVTATRASYALAYYFDYVGRMALPQLSLVPRHMGSPMDDLMDIGPGDLLFAITFPPNSADTINALRFAQEHRATVVLLSDGELNVPNINPDFMIRVSSHSTHQFGCYAGGFAVIEALVAALYRTGGTEVSQRVNDYQALREEYGAFWHKKTPKIRR